MTTAEVVHRQAAELRESNPLSFAPELPLRLQKREPYADKGETILYNYKNAANPIRIGTIKPVPYHSWNESDFKPGVTKLNLKEGLDATYDATSPCLLANFVQVERETTLPIGAKATDHVLFVFRGTGNISERGRTHEYQEGDVLSHFGDSPIEISAHDHTKIYWVHNAPMLAYLRSTPLDGETQLHSQIYKKSDMLGMVEDISKHYKDNGQTANRTSILLANKNFPQTRSITGVLWAMYGILPANTEQFPHRHQSVALDFVIDCPEGCYTMIGTQLIAHGEKQGEIDKKHKDTVKKVWSPGAVFVTPPGYWHSHHNESEGDAFVFPVQDASFLEYMRALSIKFSHTKAEGAKVAHISLQP